jgi:hypothetical protein
MVSENLKVYKRLQKKCSSGFNMVRTSDINMAIKILQVSKYDKDLIKNVNEILLGNELIMEHVVFILRKNTNPNIISRAIICYIKHYILETSSEYSNFKYCKIKNSDITHDSLKNIHNDKIEEYMALKNNIYSIDRESPEFINGNVQNLEDGRELEMRIWSSFIENENIMEIEKEEIEKEEIEKEEIEKEEIEKEENFVRKCIRRIFCPSKMKENTTKDE